MAEQAVAPQAGQIIEKCGGVKATADLVGTNENWVYRWTYAKEKGGTGGKVPAKHKVKLLEAAAAGRVALTIEDFSTAA